MSATLQAPKFAAAHGAAHVKPQVATSMAKPAVAAGMPFKRFAAANTRDALALVRQALGDDAVVMHTRQLPDGVEVLAMPATGVESLERYALPEPPRATAKARATAARELEQLKVQLLGSKSADGQRGVQRSVQSDVSQLEQSTLSFQDYVRRRMLAKVEQAGLPLEAGNGVIQAEPARGSREQAASQLQPQQRQQPTRQPQRQLQQPRLPVSQLPVLNEAVAPVGQAAPASSLAKTPAALPSVAAETQALARELRSMRQLLEQTTRTQALAAAADVRSKRSGREPIATGAAISPAGRLARQLLALGFSPVLARMLALALPADAQGLAWATKVLTRNLSTGELGSPLHEATGSFALVGATGVGKSTSAAKLAAAFVARHGAARLGLVSLDTERAGGAEVLRAHGRALGVPVHSAHDRASLADLLHLLGGKRLVLVDTAGLSPSDERQPELMAGLQDMGVRRLVVLNAATQTESLQSQLQAYGQGVPGASASTSANAGPKTKSQTQAASVAGVVLTKLDEAIRLAPALDAVIRHRLPVLAVANGQRVPQDWHSAVAATLVRKALAQSAQAPAWRWDEVGAEGLSSSMAPRHYVQAPVLAHGAQEPIAQWLGQPRSAAAPHAQHTQDRVRSALRGAI